MRLEFGGFDSVVVNSSRLSCHIPANKRKDIYIIWAAFDQFELSVDNWPLSLFGGIWKLFPGGLREEEDQSPTDHDQAAERWDGDGPVVRSQHAEHWRHQAGEPEGQGAQAHRRLPEARVKIKLHVF